MEIEVIEPPRPKPTFKIKLSFSEACELCSGLGRVPYPNAGTIQLYNDLHRHIEAVKKTEQTR